MLWFEEENQERIIAEESWTEMLNLNEIDTDFAQSTFSHNWQTSRVCKSFVFPLERSPRLKPEEMFFFSGLQPLVHIQTSSGDT